MKYSATLDHLSALALRRRVREGKACRIDSAHRQRAENAYLRRGCWICGQRGRCEHREAGVIEAEIERRGAAGRFHTVN